MLGLDAKGECDPISGLPNRRRLIDDLANVQPDCRSIALVTLADARRFNEILRALGHARSEAFIQAGARRIRQIIGQHATLYHVSILSFVWTIPDTADGPDPDVARRVIEGFSTPLLCDRIPIDTRVGLGFAELSRDPGNRAEDLRAALAAAQDSRQRPDGCAWYDPGSDAAHKRAFQLLTDMKTALAANDQLHLVFQPKVNLKTRGASAVEALARWTHPEFGPISPGEFVPLVEATALLTPLTRWVIVAALTQMVAWDEAGLELDVAVNVSPKNLEERDFVEFCVNACSIAGIPRSRLEIEVTEGVNAGHGSTILQKLASLRGFGFRIAIDDFGSGYSNMSYLTRLSAQTLKIDQSLVRGVTPESQAGRLLAGVVKLGQDLGYKIVAEGIETEDECRMLAEWGCHLGQGYIFARPMSGDAIFAWANSRGIDK